MHSLTDNVKLWDIGMDPAARTTTLRSTGVRVGRQGYAHTALIHLGTWTDGTFTFTFEGSDDDSTYTALGSATDQTPFDDPEDYLSGATNSIVVDDNSRVGTVLKLGILSNYEYLEIVCTVTAAPGTGLVYGATLATSKLRQAGPVIA